MSTEDWGVVLISIAGGASTLALILYSLFASWYRSVIGRARVTAEVGFVALLDLALYIHWTHWIPPQRLILAVYAVIALGSVMWLGAIVEEQVIRGWWMRRRK